MRRGFSRRWSPPCAATHEVRVTPDAQALFYLAVATSRCWRGRDGRFGSAWVARQGSETASQSQARAIHSIKKWAPLLGHPERRLIATGTFVVQNSGRLVIVFLGISHQQIGQIVENEPLFVVIDRGDHMVKMVLSIVHGHEPNVVCGESSRSSRRILSDGIRLAIAISHGDCFKRTGPVARRGLDHKIDRSIEMPQQSFALILACLLDYFHQRGY